MELKRVLILTSNYGDGHIKTANNLLNEFKSIMPDVEVKIVNLFEQSHPLINKMIQYTYLNCCVSMPLIYDYFYYSTRHPSKNYMLNGINGLLCTKKLKEYLEEFEPDVVINTYPYQAMPKLYKQCFTNIPSYTVVLDYGCHSQWTGSGISKYFVAHEYVKNEMIGWGIEADKIEALGIPINIEYNEKVDMNRFYEKYSIKNKELPITTIITGAYGGMKNVDKMCRSLYSKDSNSQLIVVCGKNNKLKEKLIKTLYKYADRIKILGYVENLHEVIKASNLVITKAGGLVISEILNIGTPMIIYGQPSGQEYENMKFMINNNCSFYAKNVKQLMVIIEHLLKDKNVLARMRESAKELSKTEGCDGIINSIIKDYEKHFEETKKIDISQNVKETVIV